MSDGDRGGDNQVGLKRWLWPAIIFALVVVSAAGIQHRVHYNDAARNAANYSRDAQNQIAAECGAALAHPACTREIEQARRANQRDEYDLYSQKAMALWTAVMGSMAIVGIALSGVGIYLIWRTWDATREAAENSRRTLSAYIAKERAIFKVRFAVYHHQELLVNPHTFMPKVNNIGGSPGWIESVEWEFLEGPVWPDKLRFMKHSDTIIAAHDDGISEYVSPDRDNLDGNFLAVRLSYRTVEAGPFYSHAAFKITFAPPDGYQDGTWSASITYIGGHPTDT